MDISSCNKDATEVYISGSHFQGAPKEVRQSTPGVENPSKDEETKIFVHADTGVVVHAMQFSQVNFGIVNGNFA